MMLSSSSSTAEDHHIWDPEHDWILQFERILKPGGLGSGISSSGAPKNDTAEFRQGMMTTADSFSF